MKKISLKFGRKKQAAQDTQNTTPNGRITNETVAEYRERVLAGGRRFKYPLQHNKHRIVITSVSIVIIATIMLLSICWWQLYPAQNTSKFMYRITQVLPFPVARVDGQFVRYSDYLLELGSAMHYLTAKEGVNFSSDDGKRQLDYQKRLALNKAIENAYAQKLASENGITVSDQEVDNFIKGQMQSGQLGVSTDVYAQVIQDYYDWSYGEYKYSVHNQLLRKKVVAKLDTQALQKAQNLLNQLKQGADFATLAAQSSDDAISKIQGGDLGFVPLNSSDPSGLLKTAQTLQPGQISDIITGTDGYYIIKVIEKNSTSIHMAKIFVQYKEFQKRLDQLKAGHKIQEYISVPESVQLSQSQ